jgi:hypothetical protein
MGANHKNAFVTKSTLRKVLTTVALCHSIPYAYDELMLYSAYWVKTEFTAQAGGIKEEIKP